MCNAEVLYQQYYSLIGRLDPDDPTTPPEAAQQYCEDMAAARAAIIQHQRECRECRRDIVTPTAARARQDGEALPPPPKPVPTGKTLGATKIQEREIIEAVACLNARKERTDGKQVMRAIGRSEAATYKMLRRLVAAGALRRVRGGYRVGEGAI